MKLRLCVICNEELKIFSRSDANYCSAKCRQKSFKNPFPEELIQKRRWIRFSQNKVPLTPDNGIASSTASQTWSDYEFVKSSNAGVGIGFVFNGDGIIGIDLDNAIENGQIKEWAKKILESIPKSYTEISPSGKGLHIIGKGNIGQGRRIIYEDGGIEIYGSGRYFTMTGKRLSNTPRSLKNLGNVVDKILEEINASRTTTKTD